MIEGQMGSHPLNGNDARAILGIVWSWIEGASDGPSAVGELQQELKSAGYGPLKNDDDSPEEEHDFQWGEDRVQRCVKCTLPHAHWAGGPCPGSDHPLRPGEYV